MYIQLLHVYAEYRKTREFDRELQCPVMKVFRAVNECVGKLMSQRIPTFNDHEASGFSFMKLADSHS